MRKIRIAALAVSVSMVLAVACQAPGRPHDGGIDRATWKSVKGPSHHAKESVRWYLEHTIGLLADNGDYVSTNIRVAILVGYELRRSAPHPGLSWEASLARIQRAH